MAPADGASGGRSCGARGVGRARRRARRDALDRSCVEWDARDAGRARDDGAHRHHRSAVAWGLWPLREVPSDGRVARFIEEADPSLDDRLVSAIHVMNDVTSSARTDLRPRSPGRCWPMRPVEPPAVDPAVVVPPDRLRRAGVQAAAAVILFGVGRIRRARRVARQALDALSLSLFPARVRIEVVPGDARIQAGSPLTIEARRLGRQQRAGDRGAELLPRGERRADGVATEMPADRVGGVSRVARRGRRLVQVSG